MSITDKILTLRGVWEKLKSDERPLIIYGTGNGADMVMDILDEQGIAVTAVCASDGFVRSRTFRGFKVQSISEVEELYPDMTFCLCFASSIPEVMDRIVSLSCRHNLLVPVVPVFGKDIIDREFLLENRDNIDKAYDLLYDDTSKLVFENVLTFEFTGELSYLLKAYSSREEALRDILELTDKECYADLGAYRGDTLAELCNICGGFDTAYAFEPDKKTFAKLSENTKDMKNLTLYPYALWNSDTQLTFSGGGGRQSALCDSGYTVEAKALDNILGDKKITYIKADVEGAEKEALEGMSDILKEQKPKLSVSAYHRSGDIFGLILQIHSINSAYRFYLRQHPYIPAWDTDIYCI